MRKRYITLTLLDSVIKQEVLDKINSSGGEEIRDENGMTQQQYVDLGVTVPPFFKTKRVDPDEEFNKDENYDTITLDLKIDPNKIDLIVEGDDEESSRIHYNDKYVLTVLESPEEIEKIIEDFDKYNK